VMGAGSRALLKPLCAMWHEMSFGHSTELILAGQRCLATRISFVGELGWEVAVANAGAPAVFGALIAAGARPMGHYALDACRIEKGFRHWGHDLGPEITPLEAGLGFTIDWNKGFIGKAALEAQRGQLKQRLVLCEVDGHPLVLHDEPVWEDGRVVGLTTSGGRGARTGRTLAFALIGTSPNPMTERHFEIEIAGRFHPARVLANPPFDPKGERMRA